MIQVQIDESQLKALYLEQLDKRMKEIEGEVFFMSSKELCRFVGMSWPLVSAHLISDYDFPKIRMGNKWLFPKREVAEYMQKYYEAVRDNGGDIKTYKKKGG
ncbi:helix-turn-helix domain-containing protein [Planococcus beigongshangi]|uniref:helix-turn-helix domain-containing protein n=1 Tax=Planococcus beigongshangi TaxID=2782536 RepID=UPI00193BCF13|nr:helix-turn-helix domain-containing protein [Planococcus beigongshangi]